MHRVQQIPTGTIKHNPRNARTHSKKQVAGIADSIKIFGFVNPVLVDDNGTLIAGHGRLEAAKILGMEAIPAIQLVGLTEAQKRALMLADNKLAEGARWDRKQLALELPELTELLIQEDLDISLTGFEAVEIDQLVSDFEEDASDPADELNPAWNRGGAVSKAGDVWFLGDHRLLCGDARNLGDLRRLMNKRHAAAAFLDPPYNVAVKRVVGRGRTKHAEFAMASGEMTSAEFIAFLRAVLAGAAAVSRDGAVHYVCIDWRHLRELLEAGRLTYDDMLNLVVWAKSNAGQGSFYRSQHEMIAVFRVGGTQHLNNVELGRHGRNRSNVWHYAGVNTFRAGRMDELRIHPTVKPVALVADALKDCTRLGDAVLDTFCGSGTTIMAAERVGRHAYGLEVEPTYVDAAIRRWQAFTGKDAVHAEVGRSFDAIAADQGRDAAADHRESPSGRRLKRAARHG